MRLPDLFTAGDTLEFGVNVPDYPPADGWSLVYRLVPRFTDPAQLPVQLTAAAGPAVVGDETFDYVVSEVPANTATWQPGYYTWSRWVEKAGARVTLRDNESDGVLQVLQDPSTAVAGFDGRTQARKAYDDACAARANLLAAGAAATTGQVVEVQVGDRRTKYATYSEALAGLEQTIRDLALQLDYEVAARQGRRCGPLGRVSQGVPLG
jgi:uncharacterized protein (DUF1330 family)